MKYTIYSNQLPDTTLYIDPLIKDRDSTAMRESKTVVRTWFFPCFIENAPINENTPVGMTTNRIKLLMVIFERLDAAAISDDSL